jgi:hypothetical protein
MPADDTGDVPVVAAAATDGADSAATAPPAPASKRTTRQLRYRAAWSGEQQRPAGRRGLDREKTFFLPCTPHPTHNEDTGFQG